MIGRLIRLAMLVLTATVLAFAVAVFLCSGDAAQIRGGALSIDGGWLSQ